MMSIYYYCQRHLQTEDYQYQVSEILSNPTVDDSNVEKNYLNLTTNKEIKVQHFKIKLFKPYSILFFLLHVFKLLLTTKIQYKIQQFRNHFTKM